MNNYIDIINLKMLIQIFNKIGNKIGNTKKIKINTKQIYLFIIMWILHEILIKNSPYSSQLKILL